jgi:hypothetical protein
MLHPMGQLRPHQVEQEQAHQRFGPDRQGNPPEQPNTVSNGKLAGFKQDKRQCKVDDDGRECKKQVDTCVARFAIREARERHGTFDKPERSNAPSQDQAPVYQRDMLEIRDHRPHRSVLFLLEITKIRVSYEDEFKKLNEADHLRISFIFIDDCFTFLCFD